MARPTDWWVLDLSEDPVPGDPLTIDSVATTWGQVADNADLARTQINSLLGDQAVMQWIGKAGDAFRGHSSKLPDQLGKCSDSYRQASEALTWWSGQLSSCQATADKGLALGRVARQDLQNAQAALSTAQDNAASANSAAGDLKDATANATDTAPAPDPAAVQAAVNRASSANSAVTSAQGSVHDAQARLDAAKKMVADAASLRDDHGSTTSSKLHGAADAGIPPDSFWSKLGDAIASAWHVLVEIAKVVVAIGGIIALIIGGPIAWIVFAAALIVLADTLIKYSQGKASLLDVALAAVSCIPCTKGLTTLAELSSAFKAGGLLGAGSHLLVSAKTAAIGFLRTAQQLRVGGLAGARAMFTGLGDARAAFASESGLSKFTAFYGELRSAGSGAMNAAWADHIATIGQTDPARAASLWQGSTQYPGVDAWTNDTLAAHTPLEAGYPGASGYVVPDGTMASVGNDAAAYNQGVQVGPNPDSFWGSPYRPEGMRFETTEPIDVASSTAMANPQYGAGGLPQHYVPDFSTKVINGQINAVDGAGNIIPAQIQGGHLVFNPPTGSTITLTNYGSMPANIPSIGTVGSGAPSLIQTGSRVVTEPWSLSQLGNN